MFIIVLPITLVDLYIFYSKEIMIKQNTLIQVSGKFIRELGSAGHHLVEMASREHVDLVVMGTRGLGTVRRTILGSVSDYLIHHVNTQVCICKH